MKPHKARVMVVDISSPTSSPKSRLFRMEELKKLVQTFGQAHILTTLARRSEIDLDTFITPNTINELLLEATERGAEAIIFGNVLKSRQIFALSEIFRHEGVEVWDKIDLILKIFSLHAQSSEAKLQIQLAKVRHMGPRIFGMGEELSRQGGGIGTRGIGETNTEIMKRHLRREEQKVVQKLQKVEQSRDIQRHRRRRQQFSTLALVGYTNAGKSCLMNRLSKKGVSVKDALFETLDTRIGKAYLPSTHQEVLISDTIGFIADLPPQLISAFTSTLAESIHADVLLHTVDVSDPLRDEKISVVDAILKDLNMENKPQILVFNKTDIAGKRFGKTALQKKYNRRSPVFISAETGEGVLELKNRIGTIMKKVNN